MYVASINQSLYDVYVKFHARKGVLALRQEEANNIQRNKFSKEIRGAA